MIPPHLPPPTCNTKDHERWLRVQIILVATFFGVFAGICGAAIMLGWIWPGVGGGDTWVTAQQNRTLNSRQQLEESARRVIADRVLTVYRSIHRPDTGIQYLSLAEKIGDAVIVSSDGWVVFYNSSNDATFKNWRLVGSDGSLYSISKYLPDQRSGLVFVKIAAVNPLSTVAPYQVASFVNSVQYLDEIFVSSDKEWRYGWVSSARSYNDAGSLDSALHFGFELINNNSDSVGSVVAARDGRVAGLVGDHGLLIPANAITRLLPGVLGQGKVSYRSLGVEGYFSAEHPLILNNIKTDGFLVTRVVKSNLRRNDIILQINGVNFSADSLWPNTASSDSVTLKISRAGKIMEVVAKVVEL